MNLLTNIAMTIFALQAVACTTDTSPSQTHAVQPAADSTTFQILVITKVKKPWYAWRSLVVGKMKKSFPEYQSIDGLGEKFYSFTENRKLFGGIYFWNTKASAKAWFTEKWFERTENLYGQRGQVDYYEIEKMETLKTTSESDITFWAALSEGHFPQMRKAEGLVKVVSIKNEKGKVSLLTIWETKETAVSYFSNQKMKAEYFDTPLHIAKP
jgi:heme-degrading monooxygenase HmoA